MKRMATFASSLLLTRYLEAPQDEKMINNFLKWKEDLSSSNGGRMASRPLTLDESDLLQKSYGSPPRREFETAARPLILHSFCSPALVASLKADIRGNSSRFPPVPSAFFQERKRQTYENRTLPAVTLEAHAGGKRLPVRTVKHPRENKHVVSHPDPGAGHVRSWHG